MFSEKREETTPRLGCCDIVLVHYGNHEIAQEQRDIPGDDAY